MSQIQRFAAGGFLLVATGQYSHAAVVINEALGSTTGTDSEYIELFNSGPGDVAIGGWQIELWDSDAGSSFGGADAASPYFVPAGIVLGAGQFLLLANELALTTYGVNADVVLPANAIENSSYTMVLRDAADNVIDTVLVTDGDAGDAANIAGAPITPGAIAGPDGAFLPAGFYRVDDGGSVIGLLEFSPQPSPSGTPMSSFQEPPDDPVELLISEIQGAGHASPFVGELVASAGIVTAVAGNGFYVQDPLGDGDLATSDALFVFTGGAPTVAVGDTVSLTGAVSEFFPGGAATGNLSTTQMAFPKIEVTGSAALPQPVVLGIAGRIPPTENIDDDAFASFDPETDGIDFFESLEAMRVTLPAPLAVSPTTRFVELYTTSNDGVTATGLSARRTLNISPDDFNPERLQIDADSGILPGFDFPFVNAGAQLGDVTGVVSYDFGNFQVHPTDAFAVIASQLAPEVTHIRGSGQRLTIASYNVLNLDPRVELIDNVVDQDPGEIDDDAGLGRFDAIAAQIVHNLGSPDIVALQEVQDNDGAEVTPVAAADVTLQTLADAIVAAGGPAYAFADTPGIVPAFFDGSGVTSPVGGQPGGNIRVAFLYNPERVQLAGAAEALTDPADQAVNPDNPFFGSRIPLAADFEFNGRKITLINNHLSSKGGSSPILGVEQPFEARQEEVLVNGSLDERRRQAMAVNAVVEQRLAADPDARIVVLGDLNEFEFVSPVSEILGVNLTNTTEALTANERYSYIFDGNSQQLDHILLSASLASEAEFDIVHVNAEFAALPERASDHDPLIASVRIGLRGDVDGDGDIDGRDVAATARALGAREGSPRYEPGADLNANGRIDLADLLAAVLLLVLGNRQGP